MSTIKGYNGSITAGGNVVGEVKNFTDSQNADVVDTSVLGSEWASNVPTLKRWTATAEIHVDYTDSGQDSVRSAYSSGADVALVIYKGGTSGAGNASYTGNAVIESIAYTNDVAGILTASVSFVGNGALTEAELV